MNLVVLGFFSEFIGIVVVTFLAIFDYPHHRIHGEKEWWKRFWWESWRPIFKIHPPSGKSYWMVKWDSIIIRNGIIPPKYKLNIVGFLFILIGLLLQLKVYLA